MRLGLSLPQIGPLATTDNIATIATEAEGAGFDTLWVLDRLLAPVSPRTPYPGKPDGVLPSQFATCLDPLETLTFAAAVTERIGLGTSVLDLPWYRPLLLARRLATLDVLSRGRLVVGFGLGWSRDEYDALGIPMTQRGRLADEHLAALNAIWADNPISFDGTGYRIPPGAAGPKPVQRPRPPIYFATYTEAGLRRIAKHADGWIPAGLPQTAITTMWRRLLQLTEQAGRDPDDMSLIIRANCTVTRAPATSATEPFTGTVDQIAAEILGTADLDPLEVHVELQFSDELDTIDAVLDAATAILAGVRSSLWTRPTAAAI